MNMWKIAIAFMLLATSAFGAVTLTMADPTDADNVVRVTDVQPFQVQVLLNVDQGSAATGVTFGVMADVPGLRLTDRVISHPVLTDPTTALSTLISSTNNLLDPKNKRDVGSGSADGTTPAPQGMGQLLMTLTFKPDQPLTVTTANPGHISIVGLGTTAAGVWADPDFSTWPLPINSIALTPEPASMLLLAAGAAFFARRRRA
jgi:hypothetical protein